MRVCVLGNSHAASLKTAWDDLQREMPSCRLTFFAARNDNLAGLRLQDRALMPNNSWVRDCITHTSGGQPQVVLEEFDLFLLHSLSLKMPTLEEHLSSAVITQACVDSLLHSLAYRLATMIRQAVPAPVCLVPTPQPATRRGAPPRRGYLDYDALFPRVEAALDLADAVLLRQPATTFDNDWNTKPEFSTGSVRLDIGDELSNQPHPPSDLVHMNAQYGKVILQSVLSLYLP